MQLPLQITIRDMPPTTTLTTDITRKAKKLDKFVNDIMSCHVVIEAVQKHQHNRKIYSARIDITLPGEEIVINKIHNENIYIGVRDAFEAAKRKLQDFNRIRRGDVKVHWRTFAEREAIGRDGGI